MFGGTDLLSDPTQSSGIPTRLVKTLHLSRLLRGPDGILLVEPMEELLCYHKLSKGSRLA
jgi:hypothetical protein